MTNFGQIRQTENVVVVEGQLSEVNLEYATDREGNENIRGDFKVRVAMTVKGEEVLLDVPVRVYHNKITKAGKTNPGYESMSRVLDSYSSIAAVGEDEADFIRVTGAQIRMQEYYAAGTDRLISYPSVQASFVNLVRKDDVSPKASWRMEVFIYKMNEHVAQDENDADYLEIIGIGIEYNGSASVYPIRIYDKNIAEQFTNQFSAGDTVPLSGYLNFTSVTETITEEVAIGEPIVKERTKNVSEIIVTGAKNPIPDAFTTQEIQQATALREKRLEQSKQRANQQAQNSQKTVTKEPSVNEVHDLAGF